MRRRPIEFFWIAAFCLIGAFDAFSSARIATSQFDESVLSALAAALAVFPLLLFGFSELGRTGCLALLTVVAGDHLFRIFGSSVGATVALHLMFPLACLW